MAEKVSDTIDIEADAQTIFDVATDLEAYPEWQPNVKRVDIRETDAQGRPLEVFFEVDAKIKKLGYTLAYDYSEAPLSFRWSLIEGDVKELEGSYAFDEFDDVTEVTYELKLDPGFKVPGILKRQAERQIVATALKDLKERIESEG